ncbi:MAG TPA: alpha/beta fold hydrolase [Streptosporangiales bacterium]
MPFALPRRRRARVLAALLAVVLVGAAVLVAVVSRGPSYRAEARTLTVHTGPAGRQPVRLDTTLYVPAGADAHHPVPAVLLAHGFGGTKASVAKDARDLAKLGYVVLTWTAEGFGRSGGQIHLDSPDYEVTDARRLLDWLGHRPEVARDGPDDPRVGVVGGSYGGALALLLAAYDHRVDAIVPQITWNSLGASLFPNAAALPPHPESRPSGGPVPPGVLKRAWLGELFTGGLAPRTDPSCGRFAPDVCRLYREAVTTGRPSRATTELLARSSPAGVLGRIKAPTLLIQGTADSLFPLDQADANARGIAAAGTPVRVAWYSGGHDGGDGSPDDHDRVRALTAQWLAHYLKHDGGTHSAAPGAPADAPDTSFTFSRVLGRQGDGTPLTNASSTRRYPGLGGNEPAASVPLTGPPQPVANPPDGTPAAVSSLPGGGLLDGLPVSTEIPGQAAYFQSAKRSHPLDVVGTPTITVRAASSTGSAVLFAKLYDVAPNGTATLVGGQAAALRLTGLPHTTNAAALARAAPVAVRLPGVVHRFDAGHRVRVVLDTADRAYAGPAAPAAYLVGLGDRVVRMPQVAATPVVDAAGVWRPVLAGLLGLVVLGLVAVLFAARLRRRRRDADVDQALADVPLAIRDLHKTYADGFVAVRGVGFRVERGQVVGLLGPNGAGKTTMLRVLLGLMRPTSGEVRVFGQRVVPGAPALARIGALVEGPGFLPHLSGIDNLRLYWEATGRPWADAGFDEVLAVAQLGDAVRRRVRTYSHGMRQRLAIAQAMLGLPELLILDEPTDGLDPPQIAEMRQVLRRYARDGRSVLVSSHLLGEVEQTCTHVVVMRSGELVAAGSVAEIIGVDDVLPQHRLEDAFLTLVERQGS